MRLPTSVSRGKSTTVAFVHVYNEPPMLASDGTRIDGTAMSQFRYVLNSVKISKESPTPDSDSRPSRLARALYPKSSEPPMDSRFDSAAMLVSSWL